MLPGPNQGEAVPMQPLPSPKPVDASGYEAVARLEMPDAESGMSFSALTPSAHRLTIDVDPSLGLGGTGSGPEPLELLLVALGSCTGMDVISIMRKKRQRVTHYTVNVYANLAKDYPKTYTEIMVEHIIGGDDIDPKAVARSIELSITKYCPVNALLARATHVEHVYRVVTSDE
jgi:putative redox protein